MSNGFLPTACQETKPWQTSSFHRLAQIEVLHSPPRTVGFALAHLFQPCCCPTPSSLPPLQRVPQVRGVAPGGSGVRLWGFAPPQLWTLGGCLCCVGCVSKPPSRSRNNHNLLLCVFLAQKRLIHSLKQINYFCYLKKEKRNPLELVGLSFSCVYNAVKQTRSEPEQKSLHGKRGCGLRHLPGTSAVGFAIQKVFVNVSCS